MKPPPQMLIFFLLLDHASLLSAYMTLMSKFSNINIQCIITIGILLMTMIDSFFIIGIIYCNL